MTTCFFEFEIPVALSFSLRATLLRRSYPQILPRIVGRELERPFLGHTEGDQVLYRIRQRNAAPHKGAAHTPDGAASPVQPFDRIRDEDYLVGRFHVEKHFEALRV